jgi:UDP-N-acetyl-D-mannosaminuronic acid dehydrogenase
VSEPVSIVGECGLFGLPLGIALARSGEDVILLDNDQQRVEIVANGRMPFLERGADEALLDVLASGSLLVTTFPEAISESEIVIVTIGTPVEEFMNPSVLYFDWAIDRVLDEMRDGQLLILRSTVFPGLTDRLSRRVAERGYQIDVAHCPEGIAQGFALGELTRLPQIIGRVTERAAARSAALFGRVGIQKG